MEDAEGVDLEEKLFRLYTVMSETSVTSETILAAKYAQRYSNEDNSHLDRVKEAKGLFGKLVESGVVRKRENVRGGGRGYGPIRKEISYDLIVKKIDKVRKLIKNYVKSLPNEDT